MRTVFLAPTLQPATQSPHIVHACCSIPAALGPSSNVTLIGGRKNSVAGSERAPRRSASSFGSPRSAGTDRGWSIFSALE